jgi:hypothetical protein
VRDATRYEVLAAYARASGFPRAREPAVRAWVKRGLLPEAGPIHVGFGRRVFTEAFDCGRQLLALCRLRYREGVGDLDTIGVRLWIAGYALRPSAVRRCLFHAADFGKAERAGRLVAARRGDRPTTTAEAVGVFAAVVGELFAKVGLVRPGLAAADLAVGVADYVDLALAGTSEARPDLEGMRALGRAGRIPEPGWEALPMIARVFAPSNVRRAIETATDAELLAARRVGIRAGDAALDEFGLPGSPLTSDDMAALVVVALLVLRDYPIAEDALASADVVLPQQSGATALRYLR